MWGSAALAVVAMVMLGGCATGGDSGTVASTKPAASSPAAESPRTSGVDAAADDEPALMPDVSTGLYSAVEDLRAVGAHAAFIDEAGDDVSSQFDPESSDYQSVPYVFVSQSVAAGRGLTGYTEVTVKVKHADTTITVDFSGPGGSITELDGSRLSQSTDLPQHWTKTLPYEYTTDFTATNPNTAGTVTCTITQGSKTILTNTASGPFATVSC